MGLRIAVDIDGVLADQVSLILKRLNSKYQIQLTKEDITEWDQKIGDTSIDVEIEKALLENDYVSNLPIIEGAKEGMQYLWQNHFVIVATSRPKETEDATRDWVSSNFKFHEFCNTRGKSKSCVKSDVLIDDYIPNIEDFTNDTGVGLLFSQPWNQDRSKIKHLIEIGKIYCCENWVNAINAVKWLNSR